MKLFFLSGLARSGSTLLSSILNQNPEIHAEGNSAVCQLINDVQISCVKNCKEQLLANKRLDTIKDLIQGIPESYYKNVSKKYVLDKCRSWAIEHNFKIIKKYLDENPKIIVMERNIIDIIKSFHRIYKNELILENMLTNEEPLLRSISGVIYAKENNQNNNFLIVKYEDLVNFPNETMIKIYKFLEIDYFHHDFQNIVNNFEEQDFIYNCQGLHKIRPKLEIIKNDIKLSKKIKNKCKELNKLFL